MKLLPIVMISALSLVLTHGAAAVGQTVTFTSKAPAVGSVTKENGTTNMSIDVSVKANGSVMQQMKTSQEQVSTTTTTVLAVSDVAPTKVKLACGKIENAGDQGMGHTTSASPISNKTYIAARTGETIEVTREDGGSPTSAETDAVRKELDRLGKENPFAAHLGGKSIDVGSKLDFGKELGGELFAGDEAGTVNKFDLTLTGLRGKDAVFSIDAEMVAEPQAGIKMTINLAGELVVQHDGCLLKSMKLSGPVSMNAQQNQGGMQIDIAGNGTMEVQRNASHTSGK